MERERLSMGRIKYRLSEAEMSLIKRSSVLKELLHKWQDGERVVGPIDIQGKNEVLSLVVGIVEFGGKEYFVLNEVVIQEDGGEVLMRREREGI